MANAQIHIERRAGGWVDRIRDYRVLLDDKVVGRIKRGESITLQTDPGHHELHLAIDYARSPSVELELSSDQRIDIRCWPRANMLTAPYWTTLGRLRYIGIEVTRDDGIAVVDH
jgi:hypothetical protein